MTRGLCNHRCSHPSDVDCWCDCDCEGWRDNCPHADPCETPTECERRHETCECVEAHETETECRAWLRENPPDVDVNGETE